jgi:hypothetical protein
MPNMQKTRVGRSAIQKLLNGGKLSARHLASMGKIMGTLCISRLINLRKRKSVITHRAQPGLRSVSQFAFFKVIYHDRAHPSALILPLVR